uniref:CCHC-type domain-containing protein n=1 Tax=Heliothis virescens TaxID=7102 RepID=A0A2A4JLG7_HELVI
MAEDTVASPDVESIDLKLLVRRRGGIRSRVTIFKQFIGKYQVGSEASSLSPLEVRELSLRLTQLQELLSKFDSVQSQIEDIAQNLDKQMSERDSTESEFYSMISFTQELVSLNSESSKENKSESFHSSCSKMNNSVKLPTINLPTFDGNYSKWLEYRDTFDSLINNNESIPLINKFHYLRNSLVGSACNIVRSVDFTAANYQVAWKSLCDRFNNKNILINNHLQALVNINPIQKESFKAIRYVMDQIQKKIHSLNILDISTTGWDPLVIFLVSAKLDPRTKGKWKEHKGHLTHLPSLEEFIKFLDNRANVLETANGSRHYESKNSTPTKDNRSIKSLTTALPNSKVKTCVICNKSHFIHKCNKFKALSLKDRLSEVAKHDLCINCLRSGHNNSECKLNSFRKA